ncbi:MAG: PAS domain S-box protein [Acidobacteriota bacterium]|nr:PAS domain S-box protein [Acidobacteriota bacterium]
MANEVLPQELMHPVSPEFEAFMRALPATASIKDGEGRLLYINREIEEMWETTLPAWRGKRDDELWPPEVASQLRKNDVQVLTTGKRMETIESVPLPDGSVRKFQVVKFLYQDRNQAPLVGGIGIEITQHLKAEEELEKRVRYQEVIARLASQGIFDRDVRTFLEEASMLVAQVLEVEYCGYFDFQAGQPVLRAGVGWNETDLGASVTGCCDAHGSTQIAYTYDYGEPLRVSSRAASEFVQPELFLRHEIQAAVTDLVRSRNQNFGVLGAFARLERTWSSDELNFLRTVGALIGCTLMRSRVESALSESEAHYRELFDDAPAAYHELDCTGRIRTVNRTECELLGYTEFELVGRPIWELVEESERPASEAAVLRKLNGSQQPAPFSRAYVCRDGSRIHFQINERLIRKLGQIVGISSIMVPVNSEP